MPNFDETPDWYTPEVILEHEEYDKDQYGNTWYVVKFEGDFNSHLWLAKNKPEEGKAYYGHLERTKSGKGTRFRTDKVPEDIQKPSNAKPAFQPKDERQVTKNMVWKNLLMHFDVPSMSPDSPQWSVFWGLVELHTEMLLPGEKTKESPEKNSQGTATRDWKNLGKKRADPDDELFPTGEEG